MSSNAISEIQTHGHPNVQVNINHLGSFGSDEVYSFKSPSGRLEAIYTPETSVYKIGRLDVDETAKDEGTALITTCYQHACSLNASTIVSTISSREYLETMRSALGDKYDTIKHHIDEPTTKSVIASDTAIDLSQVSPAVE